MNQLSNSSASSEKPASNRIMGAVLREDLMTVSSLLKQGADPDYTNSAGQTPLMVATWKNQGGIMHLLLGAGADIDKQDPRGQTALIHAVFHGSELAVKQLINKGADLDKVSQRGTALTAAVSGGYGWIAKLLIEGGANINIPDHEGRTALELARKRGFDKIANILKESMLAEKRRHLVEKAKQRKLKMGPTL